MKSIRSSREEPFHELNNEEEEEVEEAITISLEFV